MRKRFFICLSVILSLVLSVILCSLLLRGFLVSCAKTVKHFDDWCVTTPDGFEYYYNEGSQKGAYLLKVPDVEELVIPEYIDGKKVVKLGHCDMGIGYMNDYIVTGNNTKKLTVQHQFSVPGDASVKFYADFPNLTDLIFIDFLYCNLSAATNELVVPDHIGKDNGATPNVELRKSNREFSLEGFMPKVITIPEYVTAIEAGVFAGLTGVTIKTPYSSIPEGWQNGWNGDCAVEWGVLSD